MAGLETLIGTAAWNAAGAAGVAGAPLNLAAIGGLPGAAAAAGTAGGTWAALNALGSSLMGGGTILSGIQGKAASREEAKEMERRAADERAAGQRKAQETRRKMNLLISRSQAVSAASGAGATDPSVLTNEGEIFQEGEYQANVENYQAESRALSLEGSARRSRQAGDAGLASSILGGTGTILSGVGSYYDKYGSKTPNKFRYG